MDNRFNYDFTKLQKRFLLMTPTEVMQEWIYLSALHKQLMNCDLDTVHEYCEPIDQAREYIGFYLADLLCRLSGYRLDY